VFAGAFAAFALWLALPGRGDPPTPDAPLLGGGLRCAAASKATRAVPGVPVAGLVGPRPRAPARPRAPPPRVFPPPSLPPPPPLPRRAPPGAARGSWGAGHRGRWRIGSRRVAGGPLSHPPPWWSAAWFAWHAGPLVLIATVVLAVVGVLGLERRVAVALAIAV